MAVKWVLEPAPPSGKRTGGDAAEYSFGGQIDILVRKVITNSLDAAVSDDQPIDVRFRLIALAPRPSCSCLRLTVPSSRVRRKLSPPIARPCRAHLRAPSGPPPRTRRHLVTLGVALTRRTGFRLTAEIRKAIDWWLRIYNEMRPHEALDWMTTPAERRADKLGLEVNLAA